MILFIVCSCVVLYYGYHEWLGFQGHAACVIAYWLTALLLVTFSLGDFQALCASLFDSGSEIEALHLRIP